MSSISTSSIFLDPSIVPYNLYLYKLLFSRHRYLDSYISFQTWMPRTMLFCLSYLDNSLLLLLLLFFFFFTCPHKRGNERFELVTFTSWSVVPSQLSYLLRTNNSILTMSSTCFTILLISHCTSIHRHTVLMAHLKTNF
jgi:hypothetical protein